MRRSVLAIVLTALVVLVAGSAAAALNARVLDASATTPVGGLASYLPAASPSGSPDAARTGGAVTLGPTPGPSVSDVPDTVEDSARSVTSTPAGTGATTARQPATSVTSTGARPSSTRNGGASRVSQGSAPRAGASATHRPRPSSSPDSGEDSGTSRSSHGSGHGGSRSPSPSPSPSGSHTPDD